MLKKIVIIGPESTGKSTLCELLAQYYQTQWVPEFAREYLLRHGKNYSFEDLLTIAKGQLALEDKICAAFPTFNPQLPPTNSQFPIPKNPIFIDTDMYVMKVW